MARFPRKYNSLIYAPWDVKYGTFNVDDCEPDLILSISDFLLLA